MFAARLSRRPSPMHAPDSSLNELTAGGLLPPAQAAAIAETERTRPFSVHYELRALLYLGTVLLSGGIGVLIYQNVDSIGHGALMTAVALLMGACFYFAARHRPAFTWGEAPKTSVGADYLLLLGCLLFVALETYAQYQYGVFGTRYGLATVLPAGLFIFLAYRYDHRGVLGMGLTALASWVGLAAQPLAVFTANDYFAPGVRAAAIGLGLALTAAGLYSEARGRKAHFAFSYLLLGVNLAQLGLCATMLESSGGRTWGAALLVLAVSAGLYWYARRVQSYWFLLLGVGYGYFVACWAYVHLVSWASDFASFLLSCFFVMASALGVVLLFLNLKPLLRRS